MVRFPSVLASGRRKQLTRRETSQERAESEKLREEKVGAWS